MRRKDNQMIRISQLKLPVTHDGEALTAKIKKVLRLAKTDAISYEIVRQSVDARRKPELFFVYTVDVTTGKEKQILAGCKNPNVSRTEAKRYEFVCTGTKQCKTPPVIIGSGPAGLFCAYMLAKAGYRPVLLERGAPVEERTKAVKAFWETGALNPSSNVQFGEGGAGTFSDGKLNTLVKDPLGRNRRVLEIFVENGAPKDILYVNKPHIGTDILTDVVKHMRESILKNGGQVHFHSTVTGLLTENDRMTGLLVEKQDKTTVTMEAETVVLAIGHSARDTFEMLFEHGIPMEAKSFAVGVRIEHPQEMINRSQYGVKEDGTLGAASYKLTATLPNNRGVYSFCMCPGGYVVNASSEEGGLAVNGMSYHSRNGVNANSAVIVTVSPKDYGGEGPLCGVSFQRRLEQAAYRAANGKIPVQLFGDFCRNRVSGAFGEVLPQTKGAYAFANLRSCFPDEISESLIQGIQKFDDKIHGFSREDAVLSGVESRTSSPVRILRNEQLESALGGLYPCGEGAGYAGGITSAAMDGLKTAEKIAEKYAPFDKKSAVFRKI